LRLPRVNLLIADDVGAGNSSEKRPAVALGVFGLAMPGIGTRQVDDTSVALVHLLDTVLSA
jgi:hypothetical protein